MKETPVSPSALKLVGKVVKNMVARHAEPWYSGAVFDMTATDPETFGLPDDLVERLRRAHRAAAEKKDDRSFFKFFLEMLRVEYRTGDFLGRLCVEDLRPDTYELHRIFACAIKLRKDYERIMKENRPLREVSKEEWAQIAGETLCDMFLGYMEEDNTSGEGPTA